MGGSKRSHGLSPAKVARIEQAKVTADIITKGLIFPDPAASDTATDAAPFSIREEILRAQEGSVHYGPEWDGVADAELPTAAMSAAAAAAAANAAAVEVVNESTLAGVEALEAAGFAGHVGVMNFASAKHPGGGWATGAAAQEESLARAGALVPCIEGCPGYAANARDNNSCLYGDYLTYSPSVPLWFDADGRLAATRAQVRLVSFVSVAAPNRGAAPPALGGEAERTLARRADKCLGLLAARRRSAVVLGAFGCGVFGNDAAETARAFRRLLAGKYRGCFERVRFSILSAKGENIGEFQREFAEGGGGLGGGVGPAPTVAGAAPPRVAGVKKERKKKNRLG